MAGRRCQGRAPDYDSPEYWEARFARVAAEEKRSREQQSAEDGDASGTTRCNAKLQRSQDAVEWLGEGGVLLEQLRRHLERIDNTPIDGLPRVLHLGAGVSDLGLLAADGIVKHQKVALNPSQALIDNVDFAPSAIEIGRQRAQTYAAARRPGHQQANDERHDVIYHNRFCLADLRVWDSVQAAFASQPASAPPSGYDCILDKSTSDSLATANDVVISRDPKGALVLELLSDDVAEQSQGTVLGSVCSLIEESIKGRTLPLRTSTLDIVAVHLAAITDPGAVWAVLSFSATRFDDLAHDDERGQKITSLARCYWRVANLQSVTVTPARSAENGCKSDAHVHTPAVQHHLYVLERIGRQDEAT